MNDPESFNPLPDTVWYAKAVPDGIKVMNLVDEHGEVNSNLLRTEGGYGYGLVGWPDADLVELRNRLIGVVRQLEIHMDGRGMFRRYTHDTTVGDAFDAAMRVGQ